MSVREETQLEDTLFQRTDAMLKVAYVALETTYIFSAPELDDLLLHYMTTLELR